MAKNYFEPVDSKTSFPELEEKILKFWKENKIFEKSIESRPATKKWTFLDGPPFITGLPHYGTLLSSIPKDIFPRYWTMKGYQVRRVWGWDCHGLPAENKVEMKLGLKRKKDIEEKVGVGKFIQECKNYVSQVSSEWEWYVEHIGRWVDFKNAYKTMDTPYMESVMWVFSELYKKGHIYKGTRISLYCPHCETPISNFEVAMDSENYKDVPEIANTYKYKLEGKKDTYLLAWSTTPWTKISTTALAVNPELTYVKVEENGEKLILAKSRTSILKSKTPQIIDTFSGKDLIGEKFIPHFDFVPIEKDKKAFVVIAGDFVTGEDGSGIVTIAPYGEDDWEVMKRDNILIYLPIKSDGHFTDDVPKWAGKYYLDANKSINEDLSKRGLLYSEETITHSMPFCWRCHTQLFYNPQSAWYLNVQNLKEKMKKTNEAINWYPEHFKHGRFLKSMEQAPDWCISRSRYWGSPVPVWECKCGENFVPSSIKDLEEASGKKITDLHKPGIDEITVKCSKCGQEAHRVPEVLDSWTEAGSAPFAERHFPFNKTQKLEDFFPPDFIVEYTGQIRAWFYVLHVISTALYDSNAFKNVAVTGVILGTDGRKMSKNYGNYPDPKEMLQKYGGDALRLYLMGSPVMKGEDILISEEQYRDQIRSFILTLWNVYNFFVSYANLDGWKPSKQFTMNNLQLTILDKWILARLEETLSKVSAFLEEYNTVDSIAQLKKFVVDDLSLWYIRRSRDRVGPAAESEEDKEAFYNTTYYILCTISKLVAPFIPFISEEMYRNLTKEESVHLTEWPTINEQFTINNLQLTEQMQKAREIVERIHAQRKEKKIPIRQPLKKCQITNAKLQIKELEKLVMDEVNVKNIEFIDGQGEIGINLDIKIYPELEEEAKTRELIRKIQEERKNQKMDLTQKVEIINDWLPTNEKLVKWLEKKTLAVKVEKGVFKIVKA
jgi:isoleucyl-tRNA synthetase